ncbi:laccase domain-containing protein [Haloferula chungangensis]|uniref:Laccase domain-containing protein n=1 Tax=Haloferula chungangensis TaxID=1048331 RepID=A0ABW2L7F6_9BACT
MNRIPGLRADFVHRVDGVDVDAERDVVLERLLPHHHSTLREKFGKADWWRAEQVHGNAVAEVKGEVPGEMPEVDGLVTIETGQVLGIYVADCGPIYLADQRSGAIGLLHSGKKGTELGILGEGLKRMAELYGTRPEEVVGVLGPCIRPPDYDIDFAADIVRQAKAAGVGEFIDCGINTASDLTKYYSYRVEKGRTGRLLALLMREAP